LDILRFASDLMVNAPGWDPDYRFRVDGDAQKDAALINGFLKIVDRLTINGDADASYRLKVNGNSLPNGLAKVIATLFWKCWEVTFTCALTCALDKSIVGLTVSQPFTIT